MEINIMYMGTKPWHKAVQIIERERIVPGPVINASSFMLQMHQALIPRC